MGEHVVVLSAVPGDLCQERLRFGCTRAITGSEEGVSRLFECVDATLVSRDQQ
jgi:hypothetical protein